MVYRPCASRRDVSVEDDPTRTVGYLGVLQIIPAGRTGSRVTMEATYKFSKPGTYFSTTLVASQRDGNAKTPYTRIQNLDRVRVVVN